MRWKAFASEDHLAKSEYAADILLTAEEARQVLSCMVCGVACEWTTAMKLHNPDPLKYSWLEAYFMMVGPVNSRWQDPWKLSKGKGGGITMEETSKFSFHDTSGSKAEEADAERSSGDSWLYPGKRIRIHGLEVQPEMNGVKGTLVEEAQSLIWHVRLDGEWGDKLLKVKNMAQLHSSAGRPQPTVALEKTVSEASRETMCIAGTWTDWMPHDMLWDVSENCYVCDAWLSGQCATYFGMNRGSAGSARWRAGSFKRWCMGNVKGHYKIKVTIKDCKVGYVRWEYVPA